MDQEQGTQRDELPEESTGVEDQAVGADTGIAWEERVQTLEQQVEQARAEAAAHGEEASSLRLQLADALERCRTLLLARDPDVPEELVQGGTIDELEASYGRASTLVEQLRRQATDHAAQERVPAGAPARRGPDPSSLSSQQKIMLGLQSGG